ncbi:cell wall-binding repeat-containing protein [Planococcus sp. YIM B11945]|uniref:cell wall-binding repeat-containing protein n=1 Tax=Planococcus sp. YIM B11945 TaxID=3435410 RepID=UPI003D7C7485
MHNSSKKWKKIASVAMVTSLIASNGVMTASAATNQSAKDSEKDLGAINVLSNAKAELIKKLESSKKTDIAKEKAIEPNKEVRVIVEVEGKSAVEVASEKGVQYKELASADKTKIEKQLVSTQAAVKKTITTKNIDFKAQHEYTTTFNGFSGVVKYSEVEKIKNLPNVKNVYLSNEYERPEVTPDMTTSHDFIQSRQAWADSKLKGEGMVVAVIDTGIDPDHKDFNITDASKVDLTKDSVSSIVSANGLKGAYQNEKVPYAYNYYDKNDEISDSSPGASMHGMHVAGTVAANGDEANGGIKGVAPEAQVLGMKVFSNDTNFPSTFSDIYLAAIDDAIKLGADVLNMSLGSTSSFYEEDSAEDKAISNAVANGIVASVSAGNSGTIGYGYDNAHYDNPDYGVVGAPGLNTDTIQVAATGNLVNHFTHEVDFGNDLKVTGYGVDDWSNLKDIDVVSLKGLSGKPGALGGPADYEGIDVKGKVVLVERGEHTFIDKTNYAAAAGAAGIIVYNSATATNFYKDQGGWDIPFMNIERAGGLDLEKALGANELDGAVKQTAKEEGPEVGRATDFTSWGVTPDLEFKPELSAPGGNIYSTLENDKYGVMSGTSMAAPHVSGGAALVQQYLKNDDRFKGYTLDARTKLAKKLLLNTADVTTGEGGDTISPRRQGAGMMQLHSAVNTPVIVTEKQTDEAKVNVKDFTDSSFSFTLTAENLTGKAATYKVDTSVLADMFAETGSVTYNQMKSGDLKGAKVTAPATVTVPANGKQEFTVKIDISEGQVQGVDKDGKEKFKKIEQNVFVEGFVKLLAEDTVAPDLVVPYIGFYGEWDKPEVLDAFGPEEKDEVKFYNDIYKQLGITTDADDGKYLLDLVEVDGKLVYPISPNGDNLSDKINGISTFLRNAKEFETNILDKDGKELTTVNVENNVIKNYYNGGTGSYISYNDDRAWNGTVGGEKVEDGLYQYEYKAKIDYEDAEWQSKKLPVYVDTVAPTGTVSVDEKTNTLNLTFTDEGVGTSYYEVYVDGKRLGGDKGTFDATQKSIKLSDYDVDGSQVNVVKVVAVDYAYNAGLIANNIDDSAKPVIYLDDAGPAPLGLYGTTKIPVSGYIDEELLASLTVNGKPVDFTEGTGEKDFVFNTVVEVSGEGRHDIKIKATDVNGNVSEIARPVFVDLTNPTIGTTAPKVVDNDKKSVSFDVTVKDNFNLVKLTLDGDVLYNQDVYDEVKIPNPIAKTVTANVDLEPGVNTFTLVAVDGAGHKVTKEVKIERSVNDLRVERVKGSDRYETAVELSKEGWETSKVVVLARGDNYADALAGVPLAKKYDAPLLLSRTSKLPGSTYDEIKRLKAEKVYVLGGTGAISDAVIKQLKSDGITVERISGKDRFETAAKISEKFGKADSAIIVSGENFPDALSVASYAGSEGLPILLTRENTLPNATKAALVKLQTNRSLVIGGTSAVGKTVADSLPNAYRISGDTRYDTSLEVAKYFGKDTDRVYVATGTSYADALAGGPLASRHETGVFLVGKSITPELGEYLQDHHVEYAKVIGGTMAVSDKVVQELNDYLKDK